MADTTNFAKKTASVLDVLNMLSVAAYNAHDGRVDSKTGEPENVGGLTREDEEVTIYDKRLMDGFGVKFLGDKAIIKYHAEFLLKDVNDRDFAKECMAKINDVAKYLRKEYQKLTGKSLTLTKVDDDPTVDVSPMSKVRAWVQAKCMFKIGGLGETIPYDEQEDAIRPEIEKFLAIGKDQYPGVKKPENVKPSAKLNEGWFRGGKADEVVLAVKSFVQQATRQGRDLRDVNNAFNIMVGQAGQKGWGEDVQKGWVEANRARVVKALKTGHYLQEIANDKFEKMSKRFGTDPNASKRNKKSDMKIPHGKHANPWDTKGKGTAKPSRSTLYHQLDVMVAKHLYDNLKPPMGQAPTLGQVSKGQRREIAKKMAKNTPGLYRYALLVTSPQGYFDAVDRSITKAINNWGKQKDKKIRKPVVEPKRRSTTLRRKGMVVKETAEAGSMGQWDKYKGVYSHADKGLGATVRLQVRPRGDKVLADAYTVNFIYHRSLTNKPLISKKYDKGEGQAAKTFYLEAWNAREEVIEQYWGKVEKATGRSKEELLEELAKRKRK